jgi:tetratricopeptide (TPR) repeat protein
MQRIFSLGFLGDASSKSYTLAGAFITWIAERFGVETVRAWYAGEDITVLARMEWPALDRAFGERLQAVALPPEAEGFARAKFARPGIFGRKCPHVVDALRHEADVCRDSQRYAEAIRLYREAIAKDPVDFQSKKELGSVERRHGDKDAGRAALEEISRDENAPRTWRDRAEEALADAEFIDGQFDSAAARYHTLAERSVDEDVARTLEVKELAARDPDARPAVQGLLLGDQLHGPDVYVGGVALGEWNRAADLAQKPSSLARYLIGRNLVQRAYWSEGDALLAGSLAERPPTKRIAREALRQRAIAACARSDAKALAEIRAVIDSPDDPFAGAAGSGRRDATLRMIDRCAR